MNAASHAPTTLAHVYETRDPASIRSLVDQLDDGETREALVVVLTACPRGAIGTSAKDLPNAALGVLAAAGVLAGISPPR